MNNILAIFLEEEFLMAGVAQGKQVKTFQKNGNIQFHFYFNTVTGEYGKQFIGEVEDCKEGFAGGNINLMNDLSPITKIIADLKQQYAETSSEANIPVNLIFAESIEQSTRTKFQNLLEQNACKVVKNDLTLGQSIAVAFIERNNLNITNQKFAVLSTLGDSLNISIVNILDKYDIRTVEKTQFPDFGVNPKVYITAKELIENTQQTQLLANDRLKKLEYKRHQSKARTLLEKLISLNKRQISIGTTFHTDVAKQMKTSLDLDKVEQQTQQRIAQTANLITNFFSQKGLSTQQLDKIFIIGETLNSSEVKNAITQVVGNNGVFMQTTDSNSILGVLCMQEKPKIETPPPIKENKPPIKEEIIIKQTQTETKTTDDGKKNKMLIPIIIGIAVVLLLIVGFVFKDSIFGSKNGTEVVDDKTKPDNNKPDNNKPDNNKPDNNKPVDNPHIEKARIAFNTDKDPFRAKQHCEEALKISPDNGEMKDIKTRCAEILGNPIYTSPKKGTNGKWGFTDKNGYLVCDYNFDEAKPYRQGLAPIKKANLWGFIDDKGKMLQPPKFATISETSGYYIVSLNGKNQKVSNKGGSIAFNQ